MDTHILLIAPSFDEITIKMSSWLKEIYKKYDSQTEALFDNAASTINVMDYIIKKNMEDIIIIYYGHGIEKGFVTEERLGCEYVKADFKCSLLCDVRHFVSCQKISILSYCCWAAREFGVKIRALCVVNKFIGYKKILPYYFTNEVREAAFKVPMKEVVEDIIKKRKIGIDELIKLLNIYSIEYEKWSNNYYDDEKYLIVAMFLGYHIKYLEKTI